MPLFGLSKSDVEKMQAKRDINGLVKALSYKKDVDVRRAAAKALGNISDELAVDGLIVALNDSDSMVRWLAADSLGMLCDVRAVNGLIVALKDQSPDVRSSAAGALAKLGDARAVDALTVALNSDSDLTVRSAAAEALAKINAAAFQSALSKANRSNEGAVLCTGCGKEMASSLEYCGNCGKKLDKAPPEENLQKPPLSAPETQVHSRPELLTPYKKGSFIGQRYEVQRELGHGGFGIVYLVYTQETKRVYALKTFRDEYLKDTETRNMFRREASIWIELERHPYIVQAYFVDEVAGRLYIAMEYVAPNEMGLNSLEGYLQRQPPDLSQSLRWAIQFCYGMEYAYSKGIHCHRDIKPANIMISKDKTVKITDFGIAGVLGSTMEGKGIGTPTHMPPEQFINAAACDKRSDIYAFGIVLHQMATGGRLPFLASSPLEMLRLHSQEPVPRLNSPLSSIIQRCLEKRPERRYQTFEELRAALEQLLKGQTGETVKIPTPVDFEGWEWSNKGLSLNNLGRFNEAIKCFDTALEINPRDTVAWNDKGTSFYSLGRFNEAIKCYDRALEINPKLVEPWTNKGISLHSLGRFNEAINCYDKALEIDPQSPIAWNNKGIGFNSLGRFDEAIKCFDKALEIDPQLPGAWSNKGTSFHSLGHFNEAINCYDKALEIDPQLADAWSSKGFGFNSLGRFDEAMKCCDKALEINPQRADAWCNKGTSFHGLGRFDEAMKCCDKALEINPQLAEAWCSKGTSFHGLGRFDEAIRCCDKALEINPQLADAWCVKGLSLDFLGRFNEGIKCHDKALEINPRNVFAWNNKGQSLRILGRFDESLICCNKALEINPQLAEAWLNKGLAESKLGLERDSMISIKKFTELAPEKARQLKRQLAGG